MSRNYLDFYYKYAEAGVIPYRKNNMVCGGLCAIFGTHKLFRLMCPQYDNGCWYWGYTGDRDWDYFKSELGSKDTAFTPLRQTIVLFMAAMNNEL